MLNYSGTSQVPRQEYTDLKPHLQDKDNTFLNLQAIGATTPFFTAIMSFCVYRTPESGITYVSLLPIVIGWLSSVM